MVAPPTEVQKHVSVACGRRHFLYDPQRQSKIGMAVNYSKNTVLRCTKSDMEGHWLFRTGLHTDISSTQQYYGLLQRKEDSNAVQSANVLNGGTDSKASLWSPSSHYARQQ